MIGKDSTRACQENGLWSGSMPFCQSKTLAYLSVEQISRTTLFVEKTCESPPIVAHGEMIQPDRTSNDTVQYICQEGYQLNGSAILKCISSQWQPAAPVCQGNREGVHLLKSSLLSAIRCSDPQTKLNGVIGSGNHSVHSVVTFRCPANQTLRGSPKSQCQTNGSWSPEIPTCQRLPLHSESIPCAAHSLPHRARYVEYTCGSSRRRQRVFCRQGKIVPRLPRCFQGQ